MSASTAHTRTLPVEASIGRLVMNADYDASGSTDHHDENEGDPDCHTDIVHLWLQQMSPPELQSLQRDPDVEAGSGSSSSCHTFDNDDRVVIALGDLLVADDLGNIGTSRRDLANLLDAHDNNNALEYVGTSGARAEESSTEGGDGDGHENESTQDEDEDLMLQHWQVIFALYCTVLTYYASFLVFSNQWLLRSTKISNGIISKTTVDCRHRQRIALM